MKIPNTALEYTEGKTKPILYETDMIAEQSGGMMVLANGEKQTVLLPEYILGTVEFEHDKMTEFVKNPNYTDIHNYKNDGLVCPDETVFSFRQKTDLISLFDSDINKIIIEENDKYMEEHPEEFSRQEGKRTEADLKKFSKKEMLFPKFNQMANKITDFFTKDKDENSQDLNK